MFISRAGPGAHRRDALSTPSGWIIKTNSSDSGYPAQRLQSQAAPIQGEAPTCASAQQRSPSCALSSVHSWPVPALFSRTHPPSGSLRSRSRSFLASLLLHSFSLLRFPSYSHSLEVWSLTVFVFSTPPWSCSLFLHVFSPFPRLYRLFSRLAFLHCPCLLSNAPFPEAPNPTTRGTPPSGPQPQFENPSLREPGTTQPSAALALLIP